ncbi:GIY-YIG nuclease family protein [Fredinandcohnia humi]
MSHKLLDRGIYAIINKRLNLVYVGETQRNFLIRWIEHLNNIYNHFDNQERTMLFLNEQTKFIVLKIMNETTYLKHDFFRYEQKAYEFYKRKGWGIVSKHNYNQEGKYSEFVNGDEKLIERYKKAINQMSIVLATKNTQHTNGSVILKKLYKQVERKFGTNVDKIKGESVLSRLNKDELEFMLLELYPRFYHKILDLSRTEYNKRDCQMSFF